MKWSLVIPLACLAAVAAGIFVSGFLIGAFINRYDVVRLGEIAAIRVDRLTGKSWFRNVDTSNREHYKSFWEPIAEEK